MNLLERELALPPRRHAPRARPAPLEVAPGVRWIRMRLPFALDHINLWLLRDTHRRRAQGWTRRRLLHRARRARAAMGADLRDRSCDGLPILRVIVTHMHPDHIGLAHWLCERWNAPLWISATDYHVARIAQQRRATRLRRAARGARFMAAHGMTDPESIDEDPRAHQLLREHGARGARRTSAACSTATRVIASAAPRLALHQRLRPCARAHRAVLRRTQAC